MGSPDKRSHPFLDGWTKTDSDHGNPYDLEESSIALCPPGHGRPLDVGTGHWVKWLRKDEKN